jgi:ethanolamine utilization protein EutN
MTLGKVIGNVVSTVKHPDCDGYKMLIIQPVDPKGTPQGKSFLAFDAVQAGIGDTVIVIDEGGSGRAVLDADDKRTIRTVISGIVDAVSTE